MLFQKRLTLTSGLIDTTGVTEVVLVCRRAARTEQRAGGPRGQPRPAMLS